MLELIKTSPATKVYVALLVLTGGAVVVANSGQTIAIHQALILLAFAKIWLVIRYFMESRKAPPPVKAMYEGWVIGTALALSAFLHFPNNPVAVGARELWRLGQ